MKQQRKQISSDYLLSLHMEKEGKLAMRQYLFSFEFKENTQQSYITNYLKERKIDFFNQQQCIYADLFGQDVYYKLETVHVCGDTFEVYYYPDITNNRGNLTRMYPLVEKAVKVDTPKHTVKVTFENGDSVTTSINGSKNEVEAYYLGTVFNLGTDKDNLQKAINVEFVK
ncbi:MAG: hypothetical protein UHN47_05755 [Lachnospiraceae bacterium]|nr:hypothetical protein [Lachnospiraceae bacterium]